jgi:hypothetical protein
MPDAPFFLTEAYRSLLALDPNRIDPRSAPRRSCWDSSAARWE